MSHFKLSFSVPFPVRDARIEQEPFQVNLEFQGSTATSKGSFARRIRRAASISWKIFSFNFFAFPLTRLSGKRGEKAICYENY
ncbi:hypothetical protein CEXT_348041 [Caerostris extrusa]|uniref:Uncharacterized protein n=1 Tax=Caerostris extrusa TaxID=172846 RepID=A0AAV4Y226_CAEEX|nr:hypothetical protein CEXT_348041 [Caerostris extrusa]